MPPSSRDTGWRWRYDYAGDIAALAVIVVRDGELPSGADETVAEAGGFALVLGSGTREAASRLESASRVWLVEQSSVAPGAVASALAQILSGVRMVLLPESPDGRDLAPRLAVALGCGLLAGAVRCAPDEVEVTRLDDRLSVRVGVDGPVVVTLRPGSRGKPEPVASAQVSALSLGAAGAVWDAESLEVLQPEPSTADLAEARRIVGGGAGLVLAAPTERPRCGCWPRSDPHLRRARAPPGWSPTQAG